MSNLQMFAIRTASNQSEQAMRYRFTLFQTDGRAEEHFLQIENFGRNAIGADSDLFEVTKSLAGNSPSNCRTHRERDEINLFKAHGPVIRASEKNRRHGAECGRSRKQATSLML
jgi:hypothetical protein